MDPFAGGISPGRERNQSSGSRYGRLERHRAHDGDAAVAHHRGRGQSPSGTVGGLPCRRGVTGGKTGGQAVAQLQGHRTLKKPTIIFPPPLLRSTGISHRSTREHSHCKLSRLLSKQLAATATGHRRGRCFGIPILPALRLWRHPKAWRWWLTAKSASCWRKRLKRPRRATIRRAGFGIWTRHIVRESSRSWREMNCVTLLAMS